MEWKFGPYTLSETRSELTGPEGVVAVERHPLVLLIHLARHADRVVTKDELIDAVWNGRIVSDAAISTAIKQARKAVGDSGTGQTVIRTLHGRGFRFVAPLHNDPPHPANPVTPQPDAIPPAPGRQRPSVAVLRFQTLGDDPTASAMANALPAELISSLSRLGWLHVIARGSSFRFVPETADPDAIGRQLNIRYLICGTIETIGDMMTVTIELISAADRGLVWSDRFAAALTDIQLTRQQIVAAAITAMEMQVPRFEADAARQLAPNQFDAWSHYHLGLRHMYRFNIHDNARAMSHFETATSLDPDFARAHAGLSFTHWQAAFMQYEGDRHAPLSRAIAAADHALTIDSQDPFANFNKGRALWLTGDAEAGLAWLDRALVINPNFAQGHYSRGLSRLLTGQSQPARDAVDLARDLSPLDPMQYAMFAAIAMSHVADGDFAEAAQQADRAMQCPGAHFFITMVAAFCHELNGNRSASEAKLSQMLQERRSISQGMFFDAFPFADPDMRKLISGSLGRLGLT